MRTTTAKMTRGNRKKLCTGCGKVKSLAYFTPHRHGLGGVMDDCNACRRKARNLARILPRETFSVRLICVD